MYIVHYTLSYPFWAPHVNIKIEAWGQYYVILQDKVIEV